MTLLTVAGLAQTMTVATTQGVTYTFLANGDDMTYTDNGQTLTIQGKALSVSSIESISITETTGETTNDSTVFVSYDGTSATVDVAGCIAQYVTVGISGADVTIEQSDNLPSEITYQLSGSSSNGSFTMSGSYKASLILNGLTLTSTTGAPMTINNGKRINVELADGTVNTLTDAANGNQKACFFVKGHPEISGSGTLNLVGNAKHGFRSNEYTLLKKKLGTINITAVSDGMHIGQYLKMNGGTLSISSNGGDGIQVEATDDADDEYNGQLFINGGTLTATTSADDVKALKADAAISITDGNISLTATGAGAKGISTDGTLDISGGTVAVTTTGALYAEGTDDESKPHGIKSDGNMTISGSAKVYVASTRKAFNVDDENGAVFAINGGTVLGIGSKNSATNAGSQTSNIYSGVSVSGGQTLTYGNVSYTVPAIYANSSAKVLVSPYSTDASGDTGNTSDTGTTVDSSLAGNTVSVVWNGTSATVTAAANVAGKVTTTVKNGSVTLIQASDVGDEITYTLSGTSTNGSLYMDGSYKATFVMNGLTLTSPDSAAINIRDGKRIKVKLADGTTNSLTDGTGGSWKACLMVKGHAEFSGSGTLNLTGNSAHAYWSKEYTQVSNGTINITSAKKDGMNINQYFLMEGGAINIAGVADDGIQVSKTDDASDEYNGQVFLNGGTVSVSVTEEATKGIKSEGDMSVSGGTYTITTTGGGMYDSTDRDAKGCAGLKTDANMTISGGTLTLKSTGSGGKCIKADGTLDISGGTISATSSGSNYTYSRNYSASAKAIKVDGALTITDGNITATANAHEAIESKSTINISGGYVSATSSQDDAINSSSDFTISGGYVMGYAAGNDGLDANGNFYIKGGVVYAIGSRQPEVAIDANTEGGKKLYISGGTIITCGPLESGSSLSQACYQASSYNANTWYAVYDGNGQLMVAVKTPSTISSLGSGMVVSTSGTPTLKSGVSVSGGTTCFGGMGNLGGTVSGGSTVSLSSYTSSSSGGFGPGGGGFGPGGGGGRW